jgi:hypothetical protein
VTIAELASRDAAERVRLRDKLIQDVQWQIEQRAAHRADVEALERQLTRLRDQISSAADDA